MKSEIDEQQGTCVHQVLFKLTKTYAMVKTDFGDDSFSRSVTCEWFQGWSRIVN